VWVAAADREIPAGGPVDRSSVRWLAVPDDYVAGNVVLALEELDGATAAARLLPGEPIRRERLRPGGSPGRGEVLFRPPFERDRFAVTRVAAFAKDLAAGQVVLPHHLFGAAIGLDYLPGSLVPDPARVIGRTTCEPVLRNELVREERLLDPATGQCAVPHLP
jgi:Flp pilus assembly protein CpaB